MVKIETVCQILRDFELEPEVVDDAIYLKYEMKRLSIHLNEEDEDCENGGDKYVNVLFPAFYGVMEDEVADVLVVCNKANRELRQIKTFLSEDLDFVNSSFEFWYYNENDLRNSLKYALFMISHVRNWFFRELKNVQAESQPVSEHYEPTAEDEFDDR